MDYRTILVHADPSAHSAARIRLAAGLARTFGACLAGVSATGISRFVCPDGDRWEPGKIIAGYLDPVYAGANRCLDEFEAIARDAGAPSWERRLACDQVDDGLAREARFCDLMVLSQNDPGESTSDAIGDLPLYPILNCARPVLVVPYAGSFTLPASHVLVAWNGSREATSAMTGALPLLRRAARVTAVMLDPPPQAATAGAQAEAALAAYLGRQGVNAQVVVRGAGGDAGAALLSIASELGCGLLVMGCYGHGRMRELVLGGATRTVLASMTLPVLMAH